MTSQRSECVCAGPGRLEDSTDTAQVRSNLRKRRDETFTVWRCRECGTLVSKDCVDLEPYYQDYPFLQNELNGFYRRVYAVYLGRLRQAGLQQDHSVLDYGCGQALFIQYLQERGYSKVAGYDPYSATFNDKSVLDGPHDFIVAQDVIEHVEDPRALLEELSGYLRPGGCVCIGTPNAEELDLSQPDECLNSLHQPFHIRILSKKTLLWLGEQTGFELAADYDRYYFDTLLPFINWRAITYYLRLMGNDLDAAFEKPRLMVYLTSPRMLFYGFFGYFFPPRSEMTIIFRKKAG